MNRPATNSNPTEVQETVDSRLLDLLIDEHRRTTLPRLRRLWDYYRNPASERGGEQRSGRHYKLFQEQGLPSRYATLNNDHSRPQNPGRGWDIVIENDIAWRIQTLVDFMFGKPVSLQSGAPDPTRASLLENLLRLVLEFNGGIGFFQNLALLGSIYGHVDVVLRVLDAPPALRHEPPPSPRRLAELARRFALDLVEAPRAIPLLDPADFRQIQAYVLHYPQQLNHLESQSVLGRVRRLLGAPTQSRRQIIARTQVWTERTFQSFQGPADEPKQRILVEQSANRLGRIPVIHIQNLPQPFFYEGLSEVEPLIPLQDELNTRLSDRANRVTFQSFKMYLGRGIEDFVERPVGPGQMWQTDNLQASIQEFGGDADTPSEESHINEIREALDKTSGVTAVAAGLLRNKVGNLSSENALRITLMGLLAKTERKRVTYGVGIGQLCELILHAADAWGLLPNRAEERAVRLDWPSPLPESQSQQLRDAKLKLEIGVPPKQVLSELGYPDCAVERERSA